MKTTILGLLLLSLIAGCEHSYQARSQTEAVPANRLSALRGQSRAEVIERLGQPTREIESKGNTYWEYVKEDQIVVVVQFSRRDLEHVNQLNAGETRKDAYSPWTQTMDIE